MRKLPPHFLQGKRSSAAAATLASHKETSAAAPGASLLTSTPISDGPAFSDPVISAFQQQIRLATERRKLEELERVQSEFASYLEASRAADQLLHHAPHDLRLDALPALSSAESERVRGLLEQTLERPLRDVTEGLSRGCAWFQVGDFERALEAFQRTRASFESDLAAGPLALKLSLNQGHCYLELARLEEAKRCYKDVLRLERAHVSALRGYGLCLSKLGQSSSALVAFNRAIEAEPANAELHYQLGLVLLSVGCSDQARSSFAQAHKLEPNDLRILHELGRAQAHGGQWDEAALTLDAALAISRGCEPVERIPVVERSRGHKRLSGSRRSKRGKRRHQGWNKSLLRRPSRPALVLISMLVGHAVLRTLGL